MAAEKIQPNIYPNVIHLYGDAEVGKTSILNRFKDDKTFSGSYSHTQGKDFASKKILIAKNEIYTRVYDASPKMMNNSGAYKITRADTAIIVFAVNDIQSFKNVKEYLQKTDEYKHVFIVGNKMDMVSERAVEDQEIQDFMSNYNNIVYFEVSAKANIRINELFEATAKNANPELIQQHVKLKAEEEKLKDEQKAKLIAEKEKAQATQLQAEQKFIKNNLSSILDNVVKGTLKDNKPVEKITTYSLRAKLPKDLSEISGIMDLQDRISSALKTYNACYGINKENAEQLVANAIGDASKKANCRIM